MHGKSKFLVWFVQSFQRPKICFFRSYKAPPPPALGWLRPRIWYKLSIQIKAIIDNSEHQGRQFAVQIVDLKLVPPRLGTSPTGPTAQKETVWLFSLPHKDWSVSDSQMACNPFSSQCQDSHFEVLNPYGLRAKW